MLVPTVTLAFAPVMWPCVIGPSIPINSGRGDTCRIVRSGKKRAVVQHVSHSPVSNALRKAREK